MFGGISARKGRRKMKLAKPSKPAKPAAPLKKTKLQLIWLHFCRDWQLHLLILLPVIYLIIFNYGPMYGAQIAFRNYTPRAGITGSEWVGLKWFEKFLLYHGFKDLMVNTLAVSLYQIAVGFPLPVIFALLINTMKAEKFKGFVQNITYMPHFISTVVLLAIMNMVFSPINGIYGGIFRLFGGEGYPTDLRGMAHTFRHMYVWSGVWQQLGWNTIVYTAALSSVSQELHEAAMLDGASRWKRVIHVDFPTILPTVCIMLIMRFGSIMGVGYEKVYLMQTDFNSTVSEVISTYVYKTGMSSTRQVSYASAAGIFNSVVNCAMLILVNWITDRLSDGDVGLF